MSFLAKKFPEGISTSLLLITQTAMPASYIYTHCLVRCIDWRPWSMHRSSWNHPITFCVCWDNKRGSHPWRRESRQRITAQCKETPEKRFQLETDRWEIKNNKKKKPPSDITTYTHKSSVVLKKKWKEIGADYIVTATEIESEGGLFFVAASSSHDSNGMDLK